MALKQRIKRIEQSLQQPDQDIMVVYCDNTPLPRKEEIEAAKEQARAKGQQIILMGELEVWSR